MKKKMIVLILALVCMMVLTGCFCKHEQWKDATCTDPKTCAECGKTEGEALGHVWLAATCETPRTCEQCGITDGEAKGHAMVEASCTEAKHCEQCDLVEGEALGHVWQEATTELPQTCEVCAVTEGERIITDPRFTTEATKDIQGKWGCELPLTGEMLGMPGFEGELMLNFVLDFRNNGELGMTCEVPDEEAFMQSLMNGYVEMLYSEFAKQGLDRESADAAMVQAYGMDVETYINKTLGDASLVDTLSAMYAELNLGGVYYMEDGQLYSGLAWEGTMEPENYTLEGDTLVIDSLSDELGFDAVFHRLEN